METDQNGTFTEDGSFILKKCPECGSEIPIEETYCPYCMKHFEIYEAGFCSRCGEISRAIDNNKCSHCGSDLQNVHIASRPLDKNEYAVQQTLAPIVPAVPAPPIPNSPYPPGPPQDPWQQVSPGYPYYPTPLPASRSKDARTSLIFGIIGFFCLPVVFSVLAIVYSNRAKKEIAMRAGQVSMEGLGEAQAGMILGIIGLSLWAVFLLLRLTMGFGEISFDAITFYILNTVSILL
ncbi:MAG: DUF4190 domain-containing protein [Actinobacteria bacterium]|nr:DUF4190 domain-containing protein [Actinomycetota bacterium]